MATVLFKGEPLALEGTFPTVGQKAPDFSLQKNNLSEATLSEYAGKVLVIVTVPSVDTPVCDLEVRRFNTEAAELSDNVHIVAVSADLPFAQARWCASANATAVTTLSDHKAMSFATDYGVYISALRLHARAVFVLNASGIITYAELVPEIAEQPNYTAVLEAIKNSL